MSDAEPERHITEAGYRAWLEHTRPRMAAELTAALPQEARDAGLRFEWAENHSAGAGDAANALTPFPDHAVMTYDMVLPPYRPYSIAPWTLLRDRIARASGCYPLASGNMVHVKPGCRC